MLSDKLPSNSSVTFNFINPKYFIIFTCFCIFGTTILYYLLYFFQLRKLDYIPEISEISIGYSTISAYSDTVYSVTVTILTFLIFISLNLITFSLLLKNVITTTQCKIVVTLTIIFTIFSLLTANITLSDNHNIHQVFKILSYVFYTIIILSYITSIDDNSITLFVIYIILVSIQLVTIIIQIPAIFILGIEMYSYGSIANWTYSISALLSLLFLSFEINPLVVNAVFQST